MRYALLLTVLTATLCMPAAYAHGPKDALAAAASRFASLDGAKVHYKSLGAGKTAVVFVHGWCCDLTVWQHQAAAFNGKARMLFIDLPGYGLSDKPKVDYTIDRFARGIDAVLKDAGVEQGVLVGHSMGTPVIVRYYRLFPKKTKALVFVDGALRSFTSDPAEIERFMARFKETTFKANTADIVQGMIRPTTPADVKKHIASMISAAEPAVAISSMRGMLDPKAWSKEPIHVPSQALMAKAPFWNDDYKAFVKKLVPGIDYHEFDGVGHVLFMEKPKEFNAVLGEFLRKQGAMKD
jgi:pimeloyl-ACP methyl ester carboxylesterase